MSDEKIDQFKDEFRFLSNFYPSPFVHNGIHHKTVEHFYQAHKVIDPVEHRKIAAMKTAGETKKAGRNCDLRPDWESVKDQIMWQGLQYKIMWQGLQYKFTPGSKLAQMLLATEDVPLIEGNYWGDVYWGFDLRRNAGKNKLEKMLMKLREELRKQLQETEI